MKLENINHPEYLQWVVELKEKIQTSQLKAALSVNRELLGLYWELGKAISEKIEQTTWGNSVVESLAKDLKREFPNQAGFSRSNLFSMKRWYEFYSSSQLELKKIQQLVGQIPWGHNVMILAKVDSVDEALFYCRKTMANNWSRSVLTHQIESGLYNRKGKAITNFDKTLPEPSIGLLLCKSKSKIIAEYALRGMTQPIGIAAYELSKAIPEDMKASLPTIEEIELATTKAIQNTP